MVRFLPKKKAVRYSLIGALAVVGICFALFANVWWFKPLSINLFYERVFVKLLTSQPELLTRLGVPVLADWYKDELTDVSESRQAELREQMRQELATLRSYDRDGQSPEQLLSTDLLEWFLDDQVRGQEFAWHDYPINQLFGVQNELPSFMDSAHNVNDQSDAEAYVARLSKFGVKFDQVLEGLRVREEKGIVPPQFVIDRVLDEMNQFVAQPVEENILWFSFGDKLKKASGMDDDELLAEAKAEITETVYPAYRKLIDYFEQLRPKSTTDDGVWKLPRGDEFYTWCLRNHTTTSMTPEEVHQLGLAEVDRIHIEMRGVLETVNRGDESKSVAQHIRELTESPAHHYQNNDDGRQACIDDYNQLLEELSSLSDELFRSRPKAPLDVRRIPEFKEATSPFAYYEPPAMDGSRGGVFFVRLLDMGDMPKWAMPTLAAHEGVPGHHFQLAIAMELEDVPTFRKVLPFTAFAEGWALYTEQLVWEHGFYKNRPYGDLGRLRDELFRAVRLVVDTGIHHKRWTRQEAIDYMLDNTGMPDSEVVAEIERYIVMPGQACAYKVGMIKILELRQRAQDALGEQFDLIDFHELLLQNGSVPLDVMERLVDQYVAGKKA